MGKSMHEHVQTWDNVCDCEPEPRWQALAEQMQREADEDKGDQTNPPPARSNDRRSKPPKEPRTK